MEFNVTVCDLSPQGVQKMEGATKKERQADVSPRKHVEKGSLATGRVDPQSVDPQSVDPQSVVPQGVGAQIPNRWPE